MKKFVRLAIVFGLFQTLALTSSGQDLTGIWRGYFISDDGDQYRYEVQLTQSKKAGLTGVTYSYLDTRFYGKATFTGNFTKASSAALVQEIKTVEVKASGLVCIMKNRLVYARSGNEEFLEGFYTSTNEKSIPALGAKRGDDCGGGRVFLRKVPTSDFYLEPFLRNKKTTVAPRTTITAKGPTPGKKPASKTPVTPKPQPKKTETVARKPVNKPLVIEAPVKKTPGELVVNAKPVERKAIPVPVTIRDRKNELTKTITVNSANVTVSLYDNGEIDGDTVSIYLDGNLILANKRLSTVPISYKLQLDESSPEHTLVMVAENLGSIPPNTSLMIIQDGDKRHQVSITSTEQKNAMVRFRYEKP